jgi:hypothetical protein
MADLRKETDRLDPALRKMTLSDLLDRYLTTIQHMAKHSPYTRACFVNRIKADWPEGKGDSREWP